MNESGTALIVVDVQNDFLPGGALPVPYADRVIEPLNACIGACRRHGAPVFATRDWHPRDHCSFRARGGPWPAHCIAGSVGAAFAPGLALPPDVHIVSKATHRDQEAYSGFQGTDLFEQLRSCGCRRVLIGGLATDYCVRCTALDARQLGLQVLLLRDAVRAADVHAGDGERALRELLARGVRLLNSREACQGG